MPQNHRIKGWTTDEAFQEQCFLWERGASISALFDLFNFQDLLHAQEPFIKHRMKGRKQKKHKRSPLK